MREIHRTIGAKQPLCVFKVFVNIYSLYNFLRGPAPNDASPCQSVSVCPSICHHRSISVSKCPTDSHCVIQSVLVLFSASMFLSHLSFHLSLSLYLCQYVFVILCLCHSVDRHVPQLGLLPLLLMLYLWVHEMAMWLQRISAITEKNSWSLDFR